MVDATTGALLNRLKRGDIYATEKAQRAMENFFKESTLGALRELALRQAAHELEMRESASASDRAWQPEQEVSGASPPSRGATADRILIYVSTDASTAMLIRRGRRMADYLGADCFAVSVMPLRNQVHVTKQDQETVERHLNFARNLHIETRVLEGDDGAETIVDFARRNQITQILLSRPHYSPWSHLLGTDLILRVVRKAKDIRVIIVAERRRPPQLSLPSRGDRTRYSRLLGGKIEFSGRTPPREKRRDWLAERIGFELMVAFRRTIAPYWPTKCVFRLSAANGESKPRIGQTGQWRISVRNQCILRPFPVPACLQSCVVGTQPRVRIQSSPPVSLAFSLSRRRSARKLDFAAQSGRISHGQTSNPCLIRTARVGNLLVFLRDRVGQWSFASYTKPSVRTD